MFNIAEVNYSACFRDNVWIRQTGLCMGKLSILQTKKTSSNTSKYLEAFGAYCFFLMEKVRSSSMSYTRAMNTLTCLHLMLDN